MRQPILYAEQMWKKQRLWVMFLVLVGTSASLYMAVQHRLSGDLSSYIWLAYIPSGLALGGALLYYRRRSYAETTDAGLRISNLLSSVLVDYDLIRQARVQPLNLHFQEGRRRLVRPVGRDLMARPALFIRLRGDETAIAAIRKRLGSQLAAEDTIALPVPDPEAFSADLTARLPDRTGVNLGGAKRRKRGR